MTPLFATARHIARRVVSYLTSILIVLFAVPYMASAQTGDPPPPPEPSDTSYVGQEVTNPVTGEVTTVEDLIADPEGTATAGATAWVKTADGYTFLVKDVGEFVYNRDDPPVVYEIVSEDTTAFTVELDAVDFSCPAEPQPEPCEETATLERRLTNTELESRFFGEDTEGELVIIEPVEGAEGVSIVRYGRNGSNGRAGALFVPPRSGGRGADGPSVTYVNERNISTDSRIGIEVASYGGRGGKGGDSYLSFWSGRDGGNGGKGGAINIVNPSQYQVATSGDEQHGIFAMSRSGAAGNGGSGFAAPGGGTGGHSSDGGPVEVTNEGIVITAGDGAFGIYGLSVSNNGGHGGDQWGIVGKSGSGGYGGSGGTVKIRNDGTIQTTGALAHGVLAQSIGGSGGNSGKSGNLIVSLNGTPDNGGNGAGVAVDSAGRVTFPGPGVEVTNNGTIVTTGAESRGIFAQSIGGGGGSGGGAWGLVALGGSGSNGGSGGPVTVTNGSTGSITTTNIKSDAVFAQSVGGSGGSGADAGGLFALGGGGEKAGHGGPVTVSNFGEITTGGAGARGILAQSIGGGGGDGGNSGGMVSVGGSGGGGGFSSTVSVTNGGKIVTSKDDASGIFAQSIGGGGGNGGSAGSVSAFVGVAVGGNGGSGGAGGDVNVTLQRMDENTASEITTKGNRSTGVFAQSVGGGGGNGGGAVQVTGGYAGAVSIAVGGKGGTAGDGGTVTLSAGEGAASDITTGGDDSTGVFLQSVGGGGGNGGYAVSVAAAAGDSVGGALSVGVGGSGGAGGLGGSVNVGTFDDAGELVSVGLTGSIVTQGDRSTGLFAQSVGGGGGNGGLAVSVPVAASGAFSASVGIGIGGSGAKGGDGGDVAVGFEGDVTTGGDHSTGMLVQSVGGGGGNGGGSVAASLSASGGGALSASVGVGGSAGEGSEGGSVMAATRSGKVTTDGESSTGIIVQSVGGGGGNGGYSVSVGVAGAGTGAGSMNVGLGGTGGGGGDGGSVLADLQSDVETFRENSSGILVQSVGGGGGNGGFSIAGGVAGAGTGAGTVSVGLGGDGGTAGNGGDVSASSTGTIDTWRERSGGLIVQSVGGGGGNGGFSVSGSLSGAGTGAGAVSVGLGGGGASGGIAGTVKARSSGDITTRGESSVGILAQSVGGGGGNGGFSVNVSLTGAGTGAGAVGVGLGGSGGAGADGGIVDLDVNNDVTTLGRDSTAVIAQSVGGGGGNGGFNVSVAGAGAGTGAGSVGVGLGGTAAGGGDGRQVNSEMTGDIVTGGDNSTGLLVQSVGGGGGNGGFNVSASISGAGTGAGGASVGLGGSAGSGGDTRGAGPDCDAPNPEAPERCAVSSTLTGDVVTNGDQSIGVIAQSLGGGGGNGGINISGTISMAGKGSGAASIGLGGAGGDGGDALLPVFNAVSGNVTTSGDGSGGVLAQALGGGGGNGGLNVSGTLTAAGTGTGAVSVGIGGAGGGGGLAGDVTNTVTGDVTTGGADAYGVMAQSVGGGGGNGGINVSGSIGLAKTASGAVAVGIGGAGGGGGLAGDVSNTVTGNVTTLEARSAGVVTQSIGGGGGNGGINVSGTLTASKSASGGLSVGVGGFGGAGSDGAGATSTVTGTVITLGEESPGILTQSLGGGGGNGGVNVSAAVNLTKENGGALGIGIGGFGGGGGHAGTVASTVRITEDRFVGTAGDESSAIIAQSIGGSGGNGGVNVTGALNVTGKSGAAIGVGVGGFGGGAGDGNNVKLDVTGDVVTDGNDSHGLFAQSLGGGGGNGGVNVSASLNINKKGTGGSASIGVGGFGGEGGDAGDVHVEYEGNIDATPTNTERTGSHGLVAQSLAGGGGNGAVNVSAGLAFSSTGEDGDGHALVVGIGGFGGQGGNAGEVDVTVGEGSSITSYGTDRSAILAQSIGGGGGNGGVNVSGGVAADAPIVFGMGGFGAGGGMADKVTVNAISDLFATGGNGRGIFAQSIGGGGGDGGLNVSGAVSYSKGTTPPALVFGMGGFGGAGNISSDVDVTHEGSITTAGNDGHGIFAQSIAGGGGNGGLNVSAALILSDDNDSGGFKDLSIVAGMGGHGGSGADAGASSVSSVGDISTVGDYARGVFAQSIGGGGGNGGMNFTGNVAQKSSLATIGIGGFGSGGGNAGNATVMRGDADTAAGTISTAGTGAMGIEASSIGGGGGDAGLNLVAAVSFADDGDGGSDGGTGDGTDTKERPHPKHTGVDPEVFVNYDKVLDELEGRQTKDKEDEKQKEGESGFAVQVAIGGSGGGAGDGGEATVGNYGGVTTSGQQSHGILAQSIGGGGGNAAANIAITYVRGDAVNRGLNFALGGAGGDGGAAGTARVDHAGILETHGDDSFGIIAQSVGGGGGNASAFLNKSKGDVSKLDISIGRRGGSGGEGGDVTLNSAGTVVTHGDRSWGLIAQSIGNGGGNSSATTISGTLEGENNTAARGASLSIGLEGGTGGSAGNVSLSSEGFVTTEGTSAHAIFAQSVGGGGGNGGDASASSANASIGLGGTGGTGGTGGLVKVINDAEVRTLGHNAYGLIAQSIGGGGGTGGKSDAEIESSEPGLAISLGGAGGTGSIGGAVSVENSGVIITGGSESVGVFAQSIGGGGGNGGMAVTSLKTKAAENDEQAVPGGTSTSNASVSVPVQLAVNVGGSGGDGAAAGAVDVTNFGGVGTTGESAPGVFAQSIGGGGGNASQLISKFSGTGAKFSTGIGGTGGTGGTGGNVSVENLATVEGAPAQIVTMGNKSHGIVAMSIGGGGGSGSTVVSENEEESAQATSIAVSVNVGGSGGSGGTSGDVSVDNAGEIVTHGSEAHGIFAQSIGGGGGNGGVTYAKASGASMVSRSIDSSISIGGAGGDGNISGDVIVNNTGSIEVFGDSSYGVFAQSIGGGGGNGGMSGAAPADAEGNDSGLTQPQAPSLLNFTLGGQGGIGADSGNVFVDHQGDIVSHGADAYGIFAQSIAGGGGNAGATYSTLGGAAAEFVLPLLLGSRDGGTGEAGIVDVNTVGDITMLGANSKPFLAQSINGGGGNIRLTLDTSNTTLGQVNPGPDTPVDPVSAFIVALIEVGSEAVENGLGAAIQSEHVGTLLSLGKGSPASSTQSIGGGGGNADIDLTANRDAVIELELLLGGANSVNSSGGDIDLTRNGDTGTQGNNSAGTSVQSIGAGGGNMNLAVTTTPAVGGSSSAKAAALWLDPELIKPATAMAADNPELLAAASTGTSTASLRLGANASTGNHGGDIDLMLLGDTDTFGTGSPGIHVQSIGAGGGDVRVDGLDRLTVEFGGVNGAIGHGGDISLSNFGNIVTRGNLSHGIMLQSIGGGGGAVITDAEATDVNIALNPGNAGLGGNISLRQFGDVSVSGRQSIALFVQSLGGGGGVLNRQFAGSAGGAGSAGDISLALHGNVLAGGAEGIGVFAQSSALNGQGDIDITLEKDHLIVGGNGGTAVWLSGGRSNVLTNYGAITTLDGTSGAVVVAEAGDDTIDNFGRLVGNVDLGSGSNVIYNNPRAAFAPGGIVQLGSPQNWLINDGTLTAGDTGFAQSVDLTGSYRQSAGAESLAEIDFASNEIDQVLATGTVELAGNTAVSLLNTSKIPIGQFSRVLFSGAQGLAEEGMTVETAPSVVVNYELEYQPTAAMLNYTIDFIPSGMSDNLVSVGDYINRVQQAGGGNDTYGTIITKLVNDPDMPSYRSSLSQLSPDFYGEHQRQLIESSVDFGQRLMSCRQAVGDRRFTREGSCAWLQYESLTLDRESHGDYKTMDGSTTRISVGAQKTYESDWSFGFGYAREENTSDGFDDQWSSRGVTNHLGTSFKRRFDANKLSAVLSYGWSETDSVRRGLMLDDFTTTATRDMRIISGTFRYSYDFEWDTWYLRPIADAGINRLHLRGTSEQGAGAAGLVFEDHNEHHVWVRPGFEVGKEYAISPDYRMRVILNLAAQMYLNGGSTDIRASLIGAPPGVDAMSIATDLGDPLYAGQVGVEIFSLRDFFAQFYYTTSWHEYSDTNTGMIKFQIPLK